MSSHVTIGNVTVDLNNYTCYYKGLLLPLVSEYTWGHGGRAFLYLLGLLWIFMAVAIIADVFMCSIERITSKTTTIRIADPEAETGYREMEVKVWNNTVANLSLLAFGTSAPEILLSVIETIGGGFKAGELGPGTIVGSAAFNLLVISGICVMSIPSPDTRRIAGIKVFFVTGFTSIFAYIWIAIVLMVSSPGVVDIWEAVVTLALFPLLIAVAYLADRNFCMGKKDEQPSGMVGVPLVNGLDEMTGSGDTENDLNRLVKELGQSVRDGDISESEAVKIATARMNEDQSHDRGWYRINAMRMLTGSRKLIPRVMSNFQELYDNIKLSSCKEGHTGPNGHNAGGTNAVVEFTAKSISVVENGGKVRVGIRRFGNTNISCTVHVETINGTAIAVEDYKSFSEDIIFDQHEEFRQVYIEIVDDTEWEPDEFFFVKLSVPQGETNVVKGSVSICQVIIINDDVNGLDEPTGSGDPENDLNRRMKELGHSVRGGDIPESEAAKIATARMNEDQSHDRGWYRINATRMLTGGRKLIPRVMSNFQKLYRQYKLSNEGHTGPKDHNAGGTNAVVEFTAASLSVMENGGKVRVGIRRYGNTNISCTVHVETINGTAIAGEDYKSFSEDVVFSNAQTTLRQVYIEIVDDYEWEPDEFFFVKLSVPQGETDVVIGSVSICQIIIINDDGPGELEFDKPSFVVKESYYTARVPVNRVNGCDGHVSVKWATSDITAREGIDYKGKEGILMFDNQEASKTIDIPLLESKKKERDVCFAIELGETDGGAELGKIKRTIVTIVNDDDFDGIDSRLLDMTKANVGAMALTSHRWIDQFKEAMNVNGGDIESASFLDYVLHFLTFGWKLIFAFVPPAKYLGGWPCFILSLCCIGLLTTIINDLAGTFGCLIGMEDSITAITFVALGTSMPDIFASKTAAIMEKTADSSVGNINGSNSVNVFLGLGLSWTIASIYWAAKGEQFDYPAKSLGFSVIIYSSCAVVALGILLLRRYTSVFGRAELGGPRIPKIISGIVLISLWVFYIMMSVLQLKGVITVSF